VPDVIAKILSAGGPWAVCLAICVTVVLLVARGKLIPKSIHDSRMQDKQQLVDFYKVTTDKALAANDPREQKMTELINRMTDVLAAHDKAAR
jgi:hypothetical protein